MQNLLSLAQMGRGLAFVGFLGAQSSNSATLYLERCVRLENGDWSYLGFKISRSWFQSFKRRYDIQIRCTIKQAKEAPEKLGAKVASFMQFNRKFSVRTQTFHLGRAPLSL